MEKIWIRHYPKGIPAEIDVNEYASVREIFEESVGKYGARPAFTCMGKLADLRRARHAVRCVRRVAAGHRLQEGRARRRS